MTKQQFPDELCGVKHRSENKTNTNHCRISEIRETYLISGNAFWALKPLLQRDHDTQMIEWISKHSTQQNKVWQRFSCYIYLVLKWFGPGVGSWSRIQFGRSTICHNNDPTPRQPFQWVTTLFYRTQSPDIIDIQVKWKTASSLTSIRLSPCSSLELDSSIQLHTSWKAVHNQTHWVVSQKRAFGRKLRVQERMSNDFIIKYTINWLLVSTLSHAASKDYLYGTTFRGLLFCQDTCIYNIHIKYVCIQQRNTFKTEIILHEHNANALSATFADTPVGQF